MVDPRFMEAWFRLVAEAARGTATAQETLSSLAQASTPEEFARRMAQVMPGAPGAYDERSAARLWEEWWRMMGFMPRTRYLELLEENDTLRRQLREAELTIERLRSAGQSQQKRQQQVQKSAEQIQQATQAWENMFQQMLGAQSHWMQSWAEQKPPQDRADAADANAAPPDTSSASN
jgi:hypothetical protein